MFTNSEYESDVVKRLQRALKREGLDAPRSFRDKLKREGFEEGFLEGQLEELIERWHNQRISQLEFQQKALTLNKLLDRLEKDPKRFTWLTRSQA